MVNTKEPAYEWVNSREGYRVLIRNKHPRIAIEVQDEGDNKELADAVRKAAEFIVKGGRIK